MYTHRGIGPRVSVCYSQVLPKRKLDEATYSRIFRGGESDRNVSLVWFLSVVSKASIYLWCFKPVIYTSHTELGIRHSSIFEAETVSDVIVTIVGT